MSWVPASCSRSWRNVLRVKDVPWLADHRQLPDAVFPAAGHVALGVEAAAPLYRALPGAREITGYSFRNVNIEAVLTIPEDDYGIETIVGAELVGRASADEPGWLTFTVTSVSRESGQWTQHCVGLHGPARARGPARAHRRGRSGHGARDAGGDARASWGRTVSSGTPTTPFTDISASFLTSAREMLSDVAPDVSYSVLDVGQDPVGQGYEPAAYDIVLACEAIPRPRRAWTARWRTVGAC
ncbi:hypothetical protein diail_5786 [Diaporthe ilicicola]|nr:hypothetical protein diail_5786 [Diaporthe ilicicola]